MNWNRERQEWEGTYTCVRPVGLARGPCTALRWSVIGTEVRNIGTESQPLTKLLPIYKCDPIGPIHGPCTLLCAAYSAGGPPFDCPVHWLEGRKFSVLQAKRLKREGLRQLRKQP